MRLRSDGRLELVKYEFPFAASDTHSQICNTSFTGDFLMVLRPFFFGPSTKVPFVGGTIVANRNDWEIDDQTLPGVVTSVCRDRSTNKAIGLFVDIWFTAFAPRSLVPAPFQTALDSLVGRSVDCSIEQIDESRGNVILRIDRVGDPIT